MLTIVVAQNSTRLEYICDVIFTSILKVDYCISCDVNTNSEGPLISYGLDSNGINIPSCGLLFETKIDTKWDKFECAIEPDFTQFDVFSASFWLITRYEEYLAAPDCFDQHDRFIPEHSAAYQQGFLQIPLVQQYAFQLADVLQQQWPEFDYAQPETKYVLTYDIDSAFAYKTKPVWRQIGGATKQLIKGRFKQLLNRLKVALGQHDPYDQFEWMQTLSNAHNLETHLFFQVGDWGDFDKNAPHYTADFQAVVHHGQQFSEVGIHPSYQSHTSTERLKMEIDRLEHITNQPIKNSRQHYLKFRLPETYMSLIQQGIEHDYSMAYASEHGFRASIAMPYLFFNLFTNQVTKLTIHPTCFMDATFQYYQDKSPAKGAITELNNTFKRLGGDFVVLWHNNSLSELEHGNFWQTLLLHWIQNRK